jgi:hypothetical protein
MMHKIDFSRMQTRDARLLRDQRLALETALAAAEATIAASDWQVIRAAEGGPTLPPDLREARSTARATISRLRAELAALLPGNDV